jgi:predicted RNase H-like HicB family nuclease
MVINKSKKINFKLSVLFLREGEKFIAFSPALDLSTSGETFEEVKKRFAEIAHLFFEEVIKKDTLEQVLSELGWRKVKQNWQPPIFIARESQEISVSV